MNSSGHPVRQRSLALAVTSATASLHDSLSDLIPATSARILWISYGAAATPIGIYFWFIHSFGVNVVIEDSWNGTLPLVRALARGNLNLAELWAPHNGNRMLIPNLVLTVSDYLNHVDSKTDMYLSATAVLVAVVLLVGLCLRATPLRGLWIVPAAFLLCDLIQVQNILWAFQFAWALGMLCLLATLAALEGTERHRWLFLVALGAAIVASYTSLFGLLVWPAGLLYARLKVLPKHCLVEWVVVALCAVVLYFWQLGPISPPTHPSYALSHPLLEFRFLLALLGDISPVHHLVAGTAVIVTSAVVGWLTFHYRVPLHQLRLALTLWSFGILFDLLVTGGRAELGIQYAQSSRYSTFNLLVLVGIYLGAISILQPKGGWRRRSGYAHRPVAAAVCSVLGLLVAAHLGWSVSYGVTQGRQYRAEREVAAEVLTHYRVEPIPVLSRYLFGPGGEYVEEWAPVLQAHHWSVFSADR
ncbi:MAG: hypothetical protein ACRENX_04195 [Candidatus Dormibacteria bacterium]